MKKIINSLLVLVLGFVLVPQIYDAASMKYGDMEKGTFVIGETVFPPTPGFVLTIQEIMKASKTITNDDYTIYYKNSQGKYEDAAKYNTSTKEKFMLTEISDDDTFTYSYINNEQVFTVTFNSDGGSEVDPQVVTKNGKATAPTNPTKGTETFSGWFKDNGGTLEDLQYDFDTPITSDITLVAKWDIDIPAAGTPLIALKKIIKNLMNI